MDRGDVSFLQKHDMRYASKKHTSCDRGSSNSHRILLHQQRIRFEVPEMHTKEIMKQSVFLLTLQIYFISHLHTQCVSPLQLSSPSLLLLHHQRPPCPLTLALSSVQPVKVTAVPVFTAIA